MQQNEHLMQLHSISGRVTQQIVRAQSEFSLTKDLVVVCYGELGSGIKCELKLCCRCIGSQSVAQTCAAYLT